MAAWLHVLLAAAFEARTLHVVEPVLHSMHAHQQVHVHVYTYTPEQQCTDMLPSLAVVQRCIGSDAPASAESRL